MADDPLFEDVRELPTCRDCAIQAPSTTTNHTLISPTFGWRVIRERSPDGSTRLDWRCGPCWQVYKNARRSRSLPAPPPARPGRPR